MNAYDSIRLLLINLSLLGCTISFKGINFDRYTQCLTLTLEDLLGAKHTVKLNIKKYVDTDVFYYDPKEAIIQLFKSFRIDAILTDGYLSVVNQTIAVHTDIKDTKSLVDAIDRLLKAKGRKLHHVKGSDFFNQYGFARVCITYRFGSKYFAAVFIYSPVNLRIIAAEDEDIVDSILKVLNFCSFDLVSIIDVTMSQEEVNHG